MNGRPVYETNYRKAQNKGRTDEDLQEGLLTLAQSGATLCDVMGDYFCPHPEELTDNEEAIQKQMALIDKLHALGAEGLMSSHILKFTPAERVLEVALEQKRRGADIIKIVTKALTEEDLNECIRTMTVLKQEVKTPISYHCNGRAGMRSRIINPLLGGQIAFCIDRYSASSTMEQIDLKSARAMVDLLRKIEDQ